MRCLIMILIIFSSCVNTHTKKRKHYYRTTDCPSFKGRKNNSNTTYKRIGWF